MTLTRRDTLTLTTGLLGGITTKTLLETHNQPITPSNQSTTQQPPTNTHAPYIGSTNTKYNIYYWTDLQCEFCHRFDRETLPLIKQHHIDTQNATLYFKPTALYGPQSTKAAQSIHATWVLTHNQDDIYTYYRSLTNQYPNKRNTNWITQTTLKNATQSLTITPEQILTELSNPYTTDRITTDTHEGRTHHSLTGTPHFIIHNTTNNSLTQITGAQPYNTFNTHLTTNTP